MAERLLLFVIAISLGALSSVYLANLWYSTQSLIKMEDLNNNTDSSKIHMDALRVQMLENCYASPTQECDDQLMNLALECRSTGIINESIACRDERLNLYISNRGLLNRTTVNN